MQTQQYPDDRPWVFLTEAERKQRAVLTPEEWILVDNFIAAAKALPETICISVDEGDFEDDDDDCDDDCDSVQSDAGLAISKRITKGSCQRVAYVVKPSLVF